MVCSSGDTHSMNVQMCSGRQAGFLGTEYCSGIPAEGVVTPKSSLGTENCEVRNGALSGIWCLQSLWSSHTFIVRSAVTSAAAPLPPEVGGGAECVRQRPVLWEGSLLLGWCPARILIWSSCYIFFFHYYLFFPYYNVLTSNIRQLGWNRLNKIKWSYKLLSGLDKSLNGCISWPHEWNEISG